jgi:opacity protein-like surface antigen
MKNVSKLFTTSALILSLSNTGAFALESALNSKTEKHDVNIVTEKGKIYFGFEGGVSVPAAKGFTHKDSKTRITMKKSPLYTGLLGYEFAPGMFLEFSASRQPNFKLGIKLPEDKSNAAGKTKASADVFMLNLVYDLMDVGGITPYVVLGAGVAKVQVKEADVNHPSLKQFTLMRTVKKTSTSFAWQAGLGAAYKVSDNLRLTASAKLQVINNIKLYYKSLNQTTYNLTDKGSMKKTIGTGEFALGFTYALPF